MMRWGGVLSGRFQGLFPVLCCQYGETLGFEEGRKVVEAIFIIINNKYFSHGVSRIKGIRPCSLKRGTRIRRLARQMDRQKDE